MIRKLQLAVYSFYCCFFTWLLLSCNDQPGNKNSADKTAKGKKLASVYCQSCHLLPDPSWADARTWENGILPVMGTRLGIFRFNGKYYPGYRNDPNLDRGYYPATPALSEEEWGQIINYYVSSAPDTLKADQKRPVAIKDSLSLFTAVQPSLHYYTPTTCYVKIDSTASLIIADVMKNKIYRFDRQLKVVDSLPTKGPIVDLERHDPYWIATDIGLINPNNGRYGSVERIMMNNVAHSKKNMKESVLFHALQRPVQVCSADLNNDGRDDYVVCEFGFLTGALSWMENKGEGQYERHVLRALPGAEKAYIQDFNHDGRPDIIVLFAQGEEGIFLYTNEGNGKFSEKQLLRFPPIWGSTYFELDDFNRDGYPDILYTCGDNADYSIVLKPYHGVYIFLNDGKNRFIQKYFFPVNGCYKAIARDYDNDGDLDIAAISFFADYQHQPEEGFVYLENEGDYNFIPYSLPEAKSGRWLTMDAGDVDHDGRIDLVLGNFASGPSISKSSADWKNAPPFLLLKNTGKK